ncbi:MAG: penicillin acylase family protein [Planctomycetota bacterium]|nr:penicillin acylase family protein [Planctomycetota bacterium]
MLSLLGACQSGTHGNPDWARQVTIHRDGFGVPHAIARTDAGAVFGIMYARAEDEFSKLEQACFLPLGRNSEYLGEAGLDWDRLVHALEIPRRSKETYSKLPPEVRVLCDAAAAALNQYKLDHPGEGAHLLPRFEAWHMVAQSYSWHLFQAAQALRTEFGAAAGLGHYGLAQGSNAWAIAPNRTRRGHALLLINPHLPLNEIYEAHWMSDQGLNVSGAVPFGRNMLPIYGHNEHMAWALTVNRPDVVDLFALVCSRDQAGLRHRWKQKWRLMPEREVTVQVLTDNGLQPRTLTFYESALGPIVARRGTQDIAMRVAGLEDNRFLETQYGLTRARNLEEFQEALSLGGFLFHNVMYADREGHIWYAYNGRIPRRERGGGGDGILAGESRDEWLGYHTLSELPQVLDPECGWLQNCNSSPFAASSRSNPDPKDFLVGPEEADGRADRSRALLSHSPRFDLDSLAAAAFDTRIASADTWIPEILEAHGRLRDETPGRAADLQPAIDCLVAWDRHAALDSVATTLFFLWFEKYAALLGTSVADPPATHVLAQVMAELTRRTGDWQVPWGELNRIRRPGSSTAPEQGWPVVGGHGGAGIQATFLSRFEEEESAVRFGFRGSTYVAAIELSNPTRTLSIIPYGQSSDSNSPHFDDQSPLYARGELKEAWFSRADVKAHSKRSYRPGE